MGKTHCAIGPLKPVGLVDKRTNEESYAVVQLRKENKEGTMFKLGRLPNSFKVGRTKACIWYDSRSRKC